MKPTLDLMFSAKDAARIREIVPTTSIERRMPQYRVVVGVVLLAIVLMFVSWLALAQSDIKFGVWEGSTKNGASNIVLRLAPDRDASLSFGGLRGCTLMARYEGGRGDYSVRWSNGGYCDQLLGGRMDLTVKLVADQENPMRLDLKLTDDKGVTRDAAELKVANKVVK